MASAEAGDFRREFLGSEAQRLGGLGEFVTEELQGQGQLLDLQGLFEDGDGTEFQDVIKHLAVGVAGDDDDGESGIDLLYVLVDFVTGDVWEDEIEKTEVKLLLVESGEGVFSVGDDEPAEAGLLEEELEHVLDAGVVIDDEDGGLASLLRVEDIAIEGFFFDPPPSADLDRGQLSALNEVVNRWQRYPEILRSLLDSQ